MCTTTMYALTTLRADGKVPKPVKLFEHRIELTESSVDQPVIMFPSLNEAETYLRHYQSHLPADTVVVEVEVSVLTYASAQPT